MADHDTVPMPAAIEDIDAAWLTRALRTRSPGVTVLSSEIVDMIRGTCTKIRFRLTMDEVGRAAGIPEYVMLKSGYEPHSAAMYFMLVIEARAYGEVLPALGLRSPACYFAGQDGHQGVVIMDDLKACGVRMCHPLVPQTREEITRRISALARFHAQSWDTPDFHPGGRWDWVTETIPADGGYMGHFLNPEAWRKRVEGPQAAAASIRFHKLDWMRMAIDKLIILAERTPHVLLHGDTHLGNLYVDLDGEPGFFDPQPHRWPAMQEIAYQIGGTLDPADRRHWEADLVLRYLDELRRHGVQSFSFDEAMSQYAAFLSLGYMIFLINESFFQPVAINTAYVARFSSAMLDNNTTSVLNAIR